MNSGWIGVDLDGTLAEYSGWGKGEIGDPIPEMLRRVLDWLRAGREVRIVTARVASVNGAAFIAEQTALIETWCEFHLGQKLKVTAEKDFAMDVLWDDRCVQVRVNTGVPISA